jgi:hypothetical protein
MLLGSATTLSSLPAICVGFSGQSSVVWVPAAGYILLDISLESVLGCFADMEHNRQLLRGFALLV